MPHLPSPVTTTSEISSRYQNYASLDMPPHVPTHGSPILDAIVASAHFTNYEIFQERLTGFKTGSHCRRDDCRNRDEKYWHGVSSTALEPTSYTDRMVSSHGPTGRTMNSLVDNTQNSCQNKVQQSLYCLQLIVSPRILVSRDSNEPQLQESPRLQVSGDTDKSRLQVSRN